MLVTCAHVAVSSNYHIAEQVVKWSYRLSPGLPAVFIQGGLFVRNQWVWMGRSGNVRDSTVHEILNSPQLPIRGSHNSDGAIPDECDSLILGCLTNNCSGDSRGVSRNHGWVATPSSQV